MYLTDERYPLGKMNIIAIDEINEIFFVKKAILSFVTKTMQNNSEEKF